jgi:hypothetical protein
VSRLSLDSLAGRGARGELGPVRQEHAAAGGNATSCCPTSTALEPESADAALEKEAGEVRKQLRDFEESFLLKNGRPVQGLDDISTMAPVYRRYRRLKAALAALKGNGD